MKDKKIDVIDKKLYFKDKQYSKYLAPKGKRYNCKLKQTKINDFNPFNIFVKKTFQVKNYYKLQKPTFADDHPFIYNIKIRIKQFDKTTVMKLKSMKDKLEYGENYQFENFLFNITKAEFGRLSLSVSNIKGNAVNVSENYLLLCRDGLGVSLYDIKSNMIFNFRLCCVF
jgi:hypothetical protein